MILVVKSVDFPWVKFDMKHEHETWHEHAFSMRW